ncbi:MAG: hypothetical protein AAFV59_11195, partial [Pseudomonadota bacterium]
EYGTQSWRVVGAQAGRPRERLTRIPGVNPGALGVDLLERRQRAMFEYRIRRLASERSRKFVEA